MFEIAVTPSAAGDLDFFAKWAQRLILDTIYEQLSHEPLTPTRNRKLLRENPIAPWALRIGPFRVFYDVSVAQNRVSVRAVGHKDHNVLAIRGVRVEL